MRDDADNTFYRGVVSMAKSRKQLEAEFRIEFDNPNIKVIGVLASYRGRRRVLCYDSSAVKKWIIYGEDSAWYFDTEEQARAWRSGNRKPRKKAQA